MKCYLPFLLLLCVLSNTQAQTTDYADRMNHIFGAIDKTKVTTGYLKEFGIRFNNVESYNGALSDANWVDVIQWKSLYNSLYSMRVGSVAASMPASTTTFANLNNQQVAAAGTILLAALHYKYQQYKTTAYTGGDVTVVNERIYDVAGRNPYETKTAFAVAPMKTHIEGNTFSFKLQSNMFYTNSNLTLNTIEIDFGNGQGYQTISLNTAKNVSYTTGGEKELKIKFTYSGGTILHSHAKLYVDYIPAAQARFSGSLWTEEIPGANYLGASAIGDVTIETAGTDGVLDKPLIVVEGFDPFNRFDYWDFINNNDPNVVRSGTIDIEINLSTGQTLNEAIEIEGYDLVFINYRNGTDYIQRNAYLVEAVIDWVNDHKVGTEKNVVLGMSMGGLVARYALSHMESTGKIHETKLYISHDTPHQGANVPLAYQAFVRHLAGESIGWPVFLGFFTIDIVDLPDLVPALDDGLVLLNSPAAQQMLIYQLSGTGGSTAVASANSLQTTFLNDLRSMGYPSQGGIRNIAISNGSECGTPLDFAPHATLANLDKTVDLPWFTTNIIFTIANAWSLNPIRTLTSFLSTDTDIKAQFNLKALPNQQAQQIYSGRIYIKKEVLWLIDVEEPLIGEKSISSASSMLSIDNAGGGVYDISQFLGQLPSSVKQFILEERFNFIPTYSSLDIGSGTQPIIPNDLARVYSPVGPPLAPKNTPFHNFYTNPTTSENHVQFTLKNGNWLMEELDDDGVFGFYSCASSCATLPQLSISGQVLVCTSGQVFTLSNIAPVATVTWTATPGNLFTTSSGNGAVANLKASPSISYGSDATLTYSIQTACGSLSVNKPIWVGRPNVVNANGASTVPLQGNTLYGVSPFPCIFHSVWPSNYYYAEISEENYSKIKGYPSSINFSGLFQSQSPSINGRGLYFAPNVSGNSYNGYIQANAVNQCGSNVVAAAGYGSCSSYSYSVYPNPSTAELTVDIVSNEKSMSNSETSEGIEQDTSYEVVMMDQQGTPVYKTKTSSGKLSIDTSKMRKGIYIIHIVNGESREAITVKLE